MKKLHKNNIIFYLFVFIFIFYFFAYIHPIIPFDSDDWTNLNFIRPARPTLSQWNPTKIFPECFEPLVGFTAAYIIKPFCGDYILSLIIANSLTLTFFITLYLYSVQCLLEKKFHLSIFSNHTLIVLFLLFHFLILRTQYSFNEHLFFSHDSNCYYHYTIPNLLCTIIIIWLIIWNFHIKKYTSLFLFFIFLALFSNLYSTTILIAFIGAHLIINLFSYIKNNKKILTFVKNNYFYLCIIILWLFVQLIEVNGQRANEYGNLHEPFWPNIFKTVHSLIHTRFNLLFISISLITIIISYIKICHKQNKFIPSVNYLSLALIISTFLSIIYLILLSSKVFYFYIEQSDVIFEYMIFPLLFIILCIGFLCKEINRLIAFIPILICTIFFEINTEDPTFCDVQKDYHITPKDCISLNKKYIDQVIQADFQNKDTIIINVPKFKQEDNWPLSIIECKKFGETLYKHNITKKKIITIFNPINTSK